VYLLLALVATVLIGARHDYVHFIDQWQWVLDGNDPWTFPEPHVNAYGPLYVALAALAAVHVLLPKLLFVATWIALGLWLRRLWIARTGEEPGRLWIFYWLANPFFVIEVVHNGHFDILVAACTALAIAGRDRRPFISGALLSAGILLKFLPLLFLPLLAWEKGRLRWRLLLGCATGLLAGFGTAAALWGDSWLSPLLFAGDRPSSQMSIFVLLRGPWSPLQIFGIDDADAWSLPLMLVAATAVGLGHLVRGWSSERSCLLALALVLGFYKVGHPQFYAVLLAILPLWMMRRPRPWALPLRRGVGTYVVWLSGYTLVYKWTAGYRDWPWRIMRVGGAGLVQLCLTVWLVACVLRTEQSESGQLDKLTK
jgi:hypothetical protein